MKKSMQVKLVAILAVFTLLCQIPVGAVSLGEITTEPMQPIVPKTSLGLPLADIPEVLSVEQTVQAQNVERLRDEEETQNSAVFRNLDGTNTLYLFSENIWYEDANGEKHDYNTTLTQGIQEGTFMSANAGGNLVLPQSVSAATPISYTENGYTVTMYPTNETIGTGAEVMGGEGESRTAVTMTDEELATITALNEAAAQAAGKSINIAALDTATNTVEYFRANRDATLISSTLLHGVKNDLLMAADNNIRNYSFIVDTDGLIPVQSGETSIALVDNEGQLQGYINAEEIMDANGNKSFENEIEFLAKADGTYLVTMTVDEEFAAEAAYPTNAAIICTITNLDGAYINDIDVGTYDPNANYSTAAKLYVGNLAGEVYRTYFQLVFSDYKMAPYAINSASMMLYESSSNTSTMTIDPKIPSYQWNMSAMNWNHAANQYAFHDPYNSGGKHVYPPTAFTVTTSGWYTILMTEFVQACMRNYVSDALPETIHENRGFLLKSTSESTQMLHYFSSTNASSNKPYIVLNYTANYLGGARPYVPSDAGFHQNCLGFAANIDDVIVPPLSGVLETMYQNVYNTLTSAPYNLQVGRLNTNTSYVYPTQWRVALRYAEADPRSVSSSGFHVWVETNTGLWAHKNTDNASELIYSTDDPADDVMEWFNYSYLSVTGEIETVYMINLTYLYIQAS